MSGRLIQLRDRPIAEHERQSLFLLACVLLAAAALALTHPVAHAAHRVRPPHTQATFTLAATPAPSHGRELPPAAAHLARRFLAGYLPYVYGRGALAGVRGGSGALLRSLASLPPRVSVDMRARHPRLVRLTAIASAIGVIRVRALVSDGGVADYPIVLLLAGGQGRGLLVTGVEWE